MTTTEPAPPATDEHSGNPLHAALAAFQAELPKVGKDNTAKVDSEKGRSYTYRYADLSEISPVVLPLLGKHGLAWTTRPTITHDGRFVLRYALTHASGDALDGDYPLPNPGSSPQVLGSAITYARRYALCAVTGVAPGDDDDDAAAANAAAGRAVERPAQRPRSNHPTPPANGSEPANATPARPPADSPSGAIPSRQVAAALQLLRQTCETNKWSLERVSALYAELNNGADIRDAQSMRDIDNFRKSLFSMPDHELKAEAPADA